MSFQAEGKVASAKLLLKRVVRLTAMPAAQHLKRRGGRPSWPGALPSFNFDRAGKTSLGVVFSHVKDLCFLEDKRHQEELTQHRPEEFGVRRRS